MTPGAGAPTYRRTIDIEPPADRSRAAVRHGHPRQEMRAAEKIYSSAAGIAVAVASSATALAAVPPRPYVDPNPKFFDAHPIWGTVIAIYVVLAALIMFPTVRRRLLRWYRSQRFYYRGKDPIDILFKQIGARLSVESFAFMVSCLVGPLGGWIYILTRSRGSTSDADSTTD